MLRSRGGLVGLVLVLAACAAPAGTSQGSELASASSTAAPTVAGSPDESQPMTDQVPEELIGRILADATERTGAPRDELRVVVAEAVAWGARSLRCPPPRRSDKEAP